jgi:hypothetical protein
MKQKNKQEVPDFFTSSNNGVVAVYVTAPDILERDSPQLRGIPFLFYTGSNSTAEEVSKRQGRTYLNNNELSTLLEGMDTETRLPETIRVGDKEIPSTKLASTVVPFSFGAGHLELEKTDYKPRNREDYRNMTKAIIPGVKADRREKPTLKYKIATLLGFKK